MKFSCQCCPVRASPRAETKPLPFPGLNGRSEKGLWPRLGLLPAEKYFGEAYIFLEGPRRHLLPFTFLPNP